MRRKELSCNKLFPSNYLLKKSKITLKYSLKKSKIKEEKKNALKRQTKNLKYYCNNSFTRKDPWKVERSLKMGKTKDKPKN